MPTDSKGHPQCLKSDYPSLIAASAEGGPDSPFVCRVSLSFFPLHSGLIETTAFAIWYLYRKCKTNDERTPHEAVTGMK